MSMSTTKRFRSKSEVVRSLYPFEGQDGMFFGPGETIAVTEKGQNGWWRGTLRKNGRNMEGWFPAGYVEIDIDQPIQNELLQVHSVGAMPSLQITQLKETISPVSNGTQDLPDGWREAMTTEGKLYYYNYITQETTWHHPRESSVKQNQALNNNHEIQKIIRTSEKTPPKTPPKTMPKLRSVTAPCSPPEEGTPSNSKTELSRRGSKSSLGRISLGDGSNGSPSPYSSQGSLDSLGTTRRRKTKPINLTPVRPPCFNYPSPGEGSDQSLLNSLEVSFCDYFWEDREDCKGFEVVLNHILQGRSVCKEMAEFFRERAVLEDVYSKNLLRLSKSHYADLEQGTLGRAWQRVKKGLEEEAHYHQRLSQTLVEQMEKPLSDYADIAGAEKKEFKKVETTVYEGRKKVESAYKELEKQKNTYSDKQKQYEIMQSGQSPNKVSDKDIAKAKKKTLSAADDMKRTCDDYNEAQRKWVEESTLALVDLQNAEKERVEYVRDQLLKYVDLLNSTLESNTKVFTDVRDKVGFVDAGQDREEFVHKYATGKIRPVDLKL